MVRKATVPNPGPGLSRKGAQTNVWRQSSAMSSVQARLLSNVAQAGKVTTMAMALLAEAKAAGLLDDTTEHVSFRAPRALIEAAKRESGLSSTTDLGMVALAALARPDPVAQVLKRSRGKLGKHHTLEY